MTRLTRAFLRNVISFIYGSDLIGFKRALTDGRQIFLSVEEKCYIE
jgi:hypothetical protein